MDPPHADTSGAIIFDDRPKSSLSGFAELDS